MKCVAVVNGFSDNYEKKLQEVLGLWQELEDTELPENMIFLCKEDFPKEKLERLPAIHVKVIFSDIYDAESILPILEKQVEGMEVVIFDSGYAGIELAGRLAVRKGGVSVTRVGQISVRDGELFVKKNVYANHMQGEFLIKRMPCFITAEAGTVCRRIADNWKVAEMDSIKLKAGLKDYSIVKEACSGGLEEAKFLVAVGRGAGSKAGTQTLAKAAEHMGAEFGVSRPVAMNAWASMDRLIGVSGTMAKPKICIAAGVSAAPAFYAGIEKSDFIAAINVDEKAELMKKADVAMEGDCIEILQELSQMIGRGE